MVLVATDAWRDELEEDWGDWIKQNPEHQLVKCAALLAGRFRWPCRPKEIMGDVIYDVMTRCFCRGISLDDSINETLAKLAAERLDGKG